MIFFLKNLFVEIFITIVIVSLVIFWISSNPYFQETVTPLKPYFGWMIGMIGVFLLSRIVGNMEWNLAKFISWLLLGSVFALWFWIFLQTLLGFDPMLSWSLVWGLMGILLITLVRWRWVKSLMFVVLMCGLIGYALRLIPVYEISVNKDLLIQALSPRLVVTGTGNSNGQMVVIKPEGTQTVLIESLLKQPLELPWSPLEIQYISPDTWGLIVYLTDMPFDIIALSSQSSAKIISTWGRLQVQETVGKVITGQILNFSDVLNLEQQRFAQQVETFFGRIYTGKPTLEQLAVYKMKIFALRYPSYHWYLEQWYRYQYLRGNKAVPIFEDLKTFDSFIIPLKVLDSPEGWNMWEGMLSDPSIAGVKKFLGQIFSW